MNYTGNKYLTVQSQVVQNMKLHSEYCLFVFSKIYVRLSYGREFFRNNSSCFLLNCLSVVSLCNTFSESHFGTQDEQSFHVHPWGFFVHWHHQLCVHSSGGEVFKTSVSP